MDTLTTADSIMIWFTEQVAKKNPIDPHVWLDGALRLSVMLQTEQEKLFVMEQLIANMRKEHIEKGESVSHAKAIVEASHEYLSTRIQKAKVDRAIEFIKTSKLYARTSSELMRNGL